MIAENIDTKTRELLGALSFDAPAAETALGDRSRLLPESLYRVAGEGLPHKVEWFVHRHLASHEECCRHLCNPALLTAEAAAKLARALLHIEPRLDIRLAQAAVEWAGVSGGDQKRLRRCMYILEAVGCGSRINSALVQLLKCPNGAVRSKVVDLLVRSSTNETNIRKWLRDPDPRIRANVLESLAEIGREVEWVRSILLDNLNDPHGRAAANAAVGLYRMGVEEPAVARLSEMALSGDPSMRCSAAWAMGTIPDVRLYDLLHQLRLDPVAGVRGHALRSLTSFNRAGVKPKQAAYSEPAQDPVEQPVALPDPPPPPATEPDRSTLVTRTFGRLL